MIKTNKVERMIREIENLKKKKTARLTKSKDTFCRYLVIPLLKLNTLKCNLSLHYHQNKKSTRIRSFRINLLYDKDGIKQNILYKDVKHIDLLKLFKIKGCAK